MSLIEEYNQLTAEKNKQVKYSVKVSANLLNVRNTPGYDAKVLRVIAKEQKCTIIEEQNNWGKTSEFDGWICLDFVEKIASVEPVEAEPKVVTQEKEDIVKVEEDKGCLEQKKKPIPKKKK